MADDENNCTQDTHPPVKSVGTDSTATTRAKPIAIYSYRDSAGTLRYQVVRLESKTFSQRRPNPDRPGNWIRNLQGVAPLPYRLPELLAADPAETVFIAEGEKDVDRLRAAGLVATCNSGGAGRWRDEFANYLQARHVVVIPDNDDTGRLNAAQVARSVAPYAATVRVLMLPGLPHKGDVSDWFDAGGAVDGLIALARAAPYYRPDATADSATPVRAARAYRPYRPEDPEGPMPDEPQRVSHLALTARYDHAEVLAAVRPWMVELAEELGLRFAENDEVNQDGWRSCHAIDRIDRNPSASFNLMSGYYYDHRPPEEKLSIFDLAARLQPEKYRTWQVALRKLGWRFLRRRRR